MVHRRFVRFARVLAVAVVFLVASAETGHTDQVYGTGEGCTGFSCIGFDVSQTQGQSLRFTPTSDFELDRLKLWFMNNDFSGQSFGTVNLRVEGDQTLDGCSTPNGVVLEELSFQITAVGWDPVLEEVESVVRPMLLKGTPYWIVAQSDTAPGVNPVWVIADAMTGFMSASVFDSPEDWQCGGNGAVSGAFVEGDRVGSDFSVEVSSLVAGTEATFLVTGAEPLSTTYVVLSATGPGETFVEALNVTLELADPRLPIRPIATDASGQGIADFIIPPAASGQTLWVQAVQFDKRSNLVEAPVE